ncbi:type I-MYXAN CRISPR-associated protein Cmx8 [Tautonia sociabilis]|uniref:Type I-MYXAN CRISPR-associated protein Cmx8 n=1 Tax=Tautonia sociabilis TaxID=2080755 RepID=A0A432MDF4_9BACT|nr:type I-MYXAN CRISPR-associated protein Cmx8 [Tautonia sociabilis]RUL82178.1 type I-MYXAN CRISPR-associated protein Cmx8 [Tautonia sociabilis]
MAKKPPPERITLTFDLHDLPTAQHRAGLAGLILQIDSMGPEGNRRDPRLIPEIDEASLTATSARITFTRESMQGVFDDLYAAKLVEVVVPSKWAGVDPKPGEHVIEKPNPKTGEVTKTRGFAYDVVQPQAPCLARHLEPDRKPWLDLWRQMVWEIPRGGNNVRSRAPFEQVANSGHCGEGAAAWAAVLDFQEGQAKGLLKTDPISGALLLGAQAVNAETVPFSGRVDHNLLLHFWQVVVLTFIPQVVNKKDAKVERAGYVLAIPDVADLREFRVAFPAILSNLATDTGGRLPAQARIDLPAQAGLEVLRHLKSETGEEAAERRAGRALHRSATGDSARGLIRTTGADKAWSAEWGHSVRAVESYHMQKNRNNIKMLLFDRVVDRPRLVERYQRIVRDYRHPLFRATLMRALVQDEPWTARMIELFAEYPAWFFIEGDDTPRFLPRFGRDARELLRNSYEEVYDMRIDEMSNDERLQHLAVIIQRLVNEYVKSRAEVKTGKKAKDFPKKIVSGKERPIYPPEFREAQQRVCSDAFLAMRSRHDQDFVEYFAGSICSVAQYLPKDDYQFLIRTLMTRPEPNPVARPGLSWEDVKAIAMIAVSATSFNVRPRDVEAKGRLS